MGRAIVVFISTLHIASIILAVQLHLAKLFAIMFHFNMQQLVIDLYVKFSLWFNFTNVFIS